MSDPTRDSVTPPTGDMSAEEFRRFGHEIVDWIANYFAHIEDLAVLAQIEPGDLKAQLPTSAPENGESMEAILADVDRLIVPALTHWSHPSFFAYFATSTSAPGIFGELLSAAFDVKSMLWRTSPRAVLAAGAAGRNERIRIFCDRSAMRFLSFFQLVGMDFSDRAATAINGR